MNQIRPRDLSRYPNHFKKVGVRFSEKLNKSSGLRFSEKLKNDLRSRFGSQENVKKWFGFSSYRNEEGSGFGLIFLHGLVL